MLHPILACLSNTTLFWQMDYRLPQRFSLFLRKLMEARLPTCDREKSSERTSYWDERHHNWQWRPTCGPWKFWALTTREMKRERAASRCRRGKDCVCLAILKKKNHIFFCSFSFGESGNQSTVKNKNW